jgi:hypothetical protein
VCAFSARAARDELIKWWINLKNGGKKVENKEKYQRRTKKPARKSESSNLLLCCVLCALFGRKKEFSAGRGLCFVSCSFLLLVLVLVLFQGSHVQLGLACVCILERCWCSRSLFLLGLGRFSLYRDTRSLWRSLNTRGGCFRERNSKSTNPKARRFRASI